MTTTAPDKPADHDPDAAYSAKGAADYYDRNLAKIVGRIRTLADTVEREGKPITGQFRPAGATPHPDFHGAAERVVHEVMWRLANLNLSELMSAAYDAHQAAAAFDD